MDFCILHIDGLKHGHRREGFTIVNTLLLCETLCYKFYLKSRYFPIWTFLSLIYLFTTNRLSIGLRIYQFSNLNWTYRFYFWFHIFLPMFRIGIRHWESWYEKGMSLDWETKASPHRPALVGLIFSISKIDPLYLLTLSNTYLFITVRLKRLIKIHGKYSHKARMKLTTT